MIYALVALCFLGIARTYVLKENSPCAKVSTKKDFNAARYVGRWYEAETYGWPFGWETQCVKFDYNLVDTNGTEVVNATLFGRNPGFWGSITVPDANHPAEHKLTVSTSYRSEALWYTMTKFTTRFWVLDTDYYSYSVVYGCQIVKSPKAFSVEYAWVFTRDQNPSPDVIAKAKKVIKNNDIDQWYIYTSDQDCSSLY